MKNKIYCNKINEIREGRMQTQFLHWFGKVHAYVQYSSNPLEIFLSLCKNQFTKSEPHRDNPSLVFRNHYNLRDPQSLNQSLWIKRKKEEFSLEEKDITIKVHGETFNGFASVCPRVSFGRVFGNGALGISLISFWEDKTFWTSKTLSSKFVPKSPIYRPLMAIHKSNQKMWLLANFLKTLHW